VTLSRDKNELYLQVADPGIGFDLHRFEHHGLGLVSMRERAWLAGGRLAIHTAPQGGTRIGVRVPLAEPDRSPS
jgi:signal transduction histidine kinase